MDQHHPLVKLLTSRATRARIRRQLLMEGPGSYMMQQASMTTETKCAQVKDFRAKRPGVRWILVIAAPGADTTKSSTPLVGEGYENSEQMSAGKRAAVIWAYALHL